MRLNNQQTQSRRRRVAAAARAAQNNAVAPSEAAPSAPIEAVLSPADVEGERRELARLATESEIVVRRIGGFNFEVALRDVSAHGCQVELIEAYEVGDTVIARFPQLEPLGCRVCWTQGTTTGVEFQRKIHPAVFDHLLGRLKVAEAA